MVKWRCIPSTLATSASGWRRWRSSCWRTSSRRTRSWRRTSSGRRGASRRGRRRVDSSIVAPPFRVLVPSTFEWFYLEINFYWNFNHRKYSKTRVVSCPCFWTLMSLFVILFTRDLFFIDFFVFECIAIVTDDGNFSCHRLRFWPFASFAPSFTHQKVEIIDAYGTNQTDVENFDW